jgi:hypothetical protein
MKLRAAIVSALAITAVAGAPLAAQAAPSAQTSQPYTHLVTGHTWSTGGTYISHGGQVKLKLTTLPKATEVLIEKCDSGRDLGEVQVFTKKAPSHVLATDVPDGTCFLMLLESQAKSSGYQVTGTLSY